jgi:hypothetical protein
MNQMAIITINKMYNYILYHIFILNVFYDLHLFSMQQNQLLILYLLLSFLHLIYIFLFLYEHMNNLANNYV